MPQANGLNQCLQVYFDLLAVGGSPHRACSCCFKGPFCWLQNQWSGASKGVALVGRFAEFLVAYLQHNQRQAVEVITPHLKAIR